MDKKLQKQIDNTEKAISEIKEILIKRFDESDDVAVAVANNVISSMYSYKEPAPPIPSKSDKIKSYISSIGDLIKWVFVKKGYYRNTMRVGWAWCIGLVITALVALGIYGIVRITPKQQYPYVVSMSEDYRFDDWNKSCLQNAGCVDSSLRSGIDKTLSELKEGESVVVHPDKTYEWTMTKKGHIIYVSVDWVGRPNKEVK